MIGKARDAGPILVLDAGESLAPRGAISDAELPQRLAKADLIASALASADAIVLGADDWALGAASVRALVDRHHLPVLAANLTCDGVAPYPPSVVVERAGHRVGIVGITAGKVAGCEVGPPRDALIASVRALGTVDLVIALLPTDKAATTRALEGVAGVDLVLDADLMRVPDGVEALGDAWVLGSGHRGQMVGTTALTWVAGAHGWIASNGLKAATDKVERAERRVASLQKRAKKPDGSPDPRVGPLLVEANTALEEARDDVTRLQSPDGHHRFTESMVVLDPTVADEPQWAARVESFLRAHTDAPVVTAVVEHLAPDSSPYAGSDTCRACHTTEYAQWVGTPHATAWASLEKDHRAGDAECVACHATGVGKPGGPLATGDIGGLRDVQCEACHGAAVAHAAAPPSQRPTVPHDATVCVGCHDGARDEGRFDFPSYLPRVRHRSPNP